MAFHSADRLPPEPSNAKPAPSNRNNLVDDDDVRSLFLAEAHQRLNEMETVLRMKVDRAPADLFSALARHAHSLKGNSACLGFGSVSAFCVGMEELCRRLDREGPLPNDVLVALLLKAVKALGELISDAMSGATGMRPHHAAILARLAEWGHEPGPASG